MSHVLNLLFVNWQFNLIVPLWDRDCDLHCPVGANCVDVNGVEDVVKRGAFREMRSDGNYI